MMDSTNPPKLDERAARLERLKKIIAAGNNPYPANIHRTHTVGDFLHQFETLTDTSATLAGRVRSLRGHGGSCFLTLEDMTGSVQLFFKKDVLSGYEELLEVLDVGDFLEVSGTPFTTKKGERSLLAQAARIISKTLAPLPEKWHGLTDVELRYRKRELDLLSNADVRDIFIKRSMIVQKIREFLHTEGFMEVETPILQSMAGGAAARPFKTHHNTLDIDLYLRIAPELYLKRLVVGGFEKVFEIARCFRNEGISFQHNPEFTQVEFYWAYATYDDLMDLTERLVSGLAQVTNHKMTIEREGSTLDFTPPYPRRKFYDLIKDETGIDLEKINTEEQLKTALQEQKIYLKDDSAIGFGELVDALYKEHVRPKIIQPTFVIDYPAAMIPLAKRKEDQPDRIASTQLIVKGIEVTKAYNELNDPLEQAARFAEEEAKRGQGSEAAMPADAEFVEALMHGLPPTAGFGMGIDRLTALLTDTHSIKEVILFPLLRPLTEDTTDAE
jgi:lysyl-tRNA synthetase class 2